MEEENDLIRMRLQKLAELRARGRDPFAMERFPNRLTTLEAVAEYEMAEAASTAETDPPTARVAGRITARRGMGKASFVDLQDQAGKLQLHFKSDVLGEEYELFRLLDHSDIVGVEGPLFRTRAGEVTLEVRNLTILAKALRPLPYGHEKEGQQWNTLEDVELRYRQRYVDLAVNRPVRDAFRRRSQIISGVRRFFDDRGYIEVETPVLQSVAGGAAARPFNTHHNALDHDFHLRISLELYLKRLIVGGIEKVYEIGRVFRNEGISTRHNPEFTLLESYEAYANLEDIEELVEQLVSGLATSLYGEPKIPYKGDWISVAPPWRRLPILEGIREYAGVQPEELLDFETAKAAGTRVGVDMSHEINAGGIIEKLHERFTQPHLQAPTFITDFPAETSPLAKKDPENPLLTRRFEAYIAHQELANAFSEINDPLDQRERFQAQVALRAAGDAEAHPMDEDFLRALEYGMPPTGGLGIGLDRLVMVLTEQDSIRDVILFPQMRPE